MTLVNQLIDSIIISVHLDKFIVVDASYIMVIEDKIFLQFAFIFPAHAVTESYIAYLIDDFFPTGV